MTLREVKVPVTFFQGDWHFVSKLIVRFVTLIMGMGGFRHIDFRRLIVYL